ncbi:hypothetical protein COZ22_00150 [bacterium (Candidatus Howlettbacteria) CG_4_10_14_3_um_filter_37_10]|nr:MAG: hypothetical protein COZ22_00150 [bacterium (Candidatus Howlettbacteria) CG_4_10_14_3_um_filter_37_10]
MESRQVGSSLEGIIYYIYIIYSKMLDKYYVGYTHDVTVRIDQHNSSNSFFSKTAARAYDWQLKYKEPTFGYRKDNY